MLPKLWEQMKPVPRLTEASIGEIVEFARDGIPIDVWRREHGEDVPHTLVQRDEHHYHLHYHDYRSLSHHVRNVITWENERYDVYWPTGAGMKLLFIVCVIVVVLVFLPEMLDGLAAIQRR